MLQPGDAVLVHFGVLRWSDHVEERLRCGVFDDENRIPPRMFAITDDVSRRGSRVAEGRADTL